MPKQSFGPVIQERGLVLLNALLKYDPDWDKEKFQDALKGSLGRKRRGRGGYDSRQKLTFEVYPCSDRPGRRFIATNYSLAQLTAYVGKRELSEEEVKDAIGCLEKFEILVDDSKQGVTQKILTLYYQDQEEIQRRFRENCAEWNDAQQQAKVPKDSWVKVRRFVPEVFDLLDEQFFRRRQGGESHILKLPVATWSLVTRDSYIDREQQGDALTLAENLADYEGISLLLIRGLPGAGKTALMRWLAYQLSCRGRIVLQKKPRSDELYWLESLGEFSQQIQEGHFYLIADDLFRDDDLLEALEVNELQFPLTLIGTTRLNEDRQDLLRRGGYRIESLDLELHPEEKERIRERVCLQDEAVKARLEQMTSAELEHLTAAPSLLVLMLQLSEGKDFDLKVADLIKRLPREDDYPVYQMFEVICSFYQYGITTPPEILPLCLPEYSGKAIRKAIDLAPHAELNGLVNTTEKFGYEGLATIHELIAQTAMTVKYPRSHGDNLPYTPNCLKDHLNDAIVNLDATKETHKHWAPNVLRPLAVNGETDLVSQVLQDYPEIIHVLQQGSNVTGWSIWAKMYYVLGLIDERDRCLTAILSTDPQNSYEWGYWLSLIGKFGTNQQKQEAIPQTATWLQLHPENSSVRTQYLALIRWYGKLQQKQEALAQTATWLQLHPDEYNVRDQHLALIMQYGTGKQKQEALAQTAIWLQLHPDEHHVRFQYLGLIMQYGTRKQKQEALAQTASWLQLHLDEQEVWRRYLLVIEQNGKPQQKQEALAQTATWLQQYPENSSVRTQYLALIRRHGKLQQKQEVLAQTATWLQQHPENNSVRIQYLRLMGQDGKLQQKQEALAQTATWLQQHPDAGDVRTQYLKLMDKCGTPQQKQQALNEAAKWLLQHSNYRVACKQYLSLIGQYGTLEQKQEALAEIASWLLQQPNDTDIRTQYLALIGQYGTIQQKQEALAQTATWLQQHPDHPDVGDVYTQYLALIGKYGTPQEKEEALAQTVTWLQEHPEHPDARNVRTQYLVLTGKDGTIKQKQEALAQTATWLQEHPDARNVRTQYLAFVSKAGKDIINVEPIIREQWQWISQQPMVHQSLWEAFMPVLFLHAQPNLVPLIHPAINFALEQYPENRNILGVVFCYFRDYLDYKICYKLANFTSKNEFTKPIKHWQRFIYAANFFRDYRKFGKAKGIYKKVINSAKKWNPKEPKDVESLKETINFAYIEYACLLILRAPPDPDKAIDYLKPILEENPKHELAQLYMAQCYQVIGQRSHAEERQRFYSQAIEHFQKAIEFDKQKTGYFWYEFGCFYRDAMENPTEARKCLSNALKQKVHLPTCVDLAELEVQEGNWERAKELLEQGLALVPFTRPEKEKLKELQPRIQAMQQAIQDRLGS